MGGATALFFFSEAVIKNIFYGYSHTWLRIIASAAAIVPAAIVLFNTALSLVQALFSRSVQTGGASVHGFF